MKRLLGFLILAFAVLMYAPRIAALLYRVPSNFLNFSFCVCCPGRAVSCFTQFNSFGTLTTCLVGS